MADLKMDIIKQVKNRISLIVFFTGILLLIFSLMRINKWGPVEVVFLGGLGILISVFSLDLQSNGKISPLGVSGFLISLSGVILYYFHDTYLSDTVSVLYSLGLTILLCDILLGIFTARRESPRLLPPITLEGNRDITYQYHTVIGNNLTDAMNSVEGLISQLSQEKAQMNDEVKKEIATILETLDALESIKLTDDNKSINMLYNRLYEHLEIRDITEIQVKTGDRYDPQYHKSINKMPKTGMTGKIKKIVTKGYITTVDNVEEVIRKTVVDVDWAESG